MALPVVLLPKTCTRASFSARLTDFTCFLPSRLAKNYTRVAFNVVVAMICGLSLVLCGRSIVRGILLQHVGETHTLQLRALSKEINSMLLNSRLYANAFSSPGVCTVL